MYCTSPPFVRARLMEWTWNCALFKPLPSITALHCRPASTNHTCTIGSFILHHHLNYSTEVNNISCTCKIKISKFPFCFCGVETIIPKLPDLTTCTLQSTPCNFYLPQKLCIELEIGLKPSLLINFKKIIA